jgi:malonate-semialdehyde dehydrogenase (acetylating)/methylmalonate-semialdehyde dehydrogenase
VLQAFGKRMQCQGGAKNPIIVLPDADMEMTTRITADSAFGCAGQRCLAASVAVTVGRSAVITFTEAITLTAAQTTSGWLWLRSKRHKWGQSLLPKVKRPN